MGGRRRTLDYEILSMLKESRMELYNVVITARFGCASADADVVGRCLHRIAKLF